MKVIFISSCCEEKLNQRGKSLTTHPQVQTRENMGLKTPLEIHHIFYTRIVFLKETHLKKRMQKLVYIKKIFSIFLDHTEMCKTVRSEMPCCLTVKLKEKNKSERNL